MAPPFIAYFAVLDNGGGELPLLQVAYDQCRLYRDALRDPGGLWKHVVLGSWQDNSHWATGSHTSCCSSRPKIIKLLLGNAWAAAGMLRVRETIRHSGQASILAQQQANLTEWIQEILNATLPYQVCPPAAAHDQHHSIFH